MNSVLLLDVRQFESQYLPKYSEKFKIFYKALREAKKVHKDTKVHVYSGSNMIAKAALDNIFEDDQVIASACPRVRSLRNSFVLLEKEQFKKKI